MERSPTTSNTGPVVYAGRFADQVFGLPEGYRILSEWDVLPWQLAASARGAPALVVIDLLSFPFEAMTDDQWDIPLVVVLPGGFDAGFLSTVFGEPLFAHLGFFDRVATPDDAVWEELSQTYGWAENQRLRISGEDPTEAAAEIRALLEAEGAVPELSGNGRYEAYRYWNERGDALAHAAPQRAVCGRRPGFEKAVHRTQAEALEEQFASARGEREADVPFDVLEVGAGVGRWASSFDLARTNFVGVDIGESMVAAARANVPEARFEHLGPDLALPYEDERFDLVFTVDVLHHNPAPAKRALLSEMWRVARPGGRLLFLEDFVAERRSEGSTVYPMSVLQFVELMTQASAGRVTLEYVESLRYPGDDLVRAGLITLCKLGVPGRW